MSPRHGLLTGLLSLLFVLTPAIAAAASGVGIRWDACVGDAGRINRDFACDTNAGFETLVGSFELGAEIPEATGLEIVLDLQSASSVLPAWWEFRNTGSCRFNALSFTTTAPTDAALCQDWAQGQAAGAVGGYVVGFKSAYTARLLAATAVLASAAMTLVPEQEYFAFTLRIQHSRTVGAGSCDGCCTPVGLVLKVVKVVTTVPTNDRTLSGPTNGTDSDFAQWQRYPFPRGTMPQPAPPCGPVPTRSRTWSELKALYR